MTNTIKPDPQDDHDDPLGDLAVAVLGAVLAVLALPILLVMWTVHILAQHPSAWRRHVWWQWWLTSALFLLGALGFWDVVTSPPGSAVWTALAGLLSVWAMQTPVAVGVYSYQLSRIATALDEGRLMPSRADKVRRAIWQGTGVDAEQRARRHRDGEGPSSTLGYIYREDRRDVVTRRNDRRTQSLKRQEAEGWIEADRVQLPTREPARAVLCAGSGSGKTVLLHNAVVAALQQGQSVIYIDCKADREGAEQLIKLAAAHNVPCREWRIDGRAPYAAWHGSVEDCIAKVDILLGAQPTSDAAKHYHARTLKALRAVTVTAGPWTSTTDLLNRLQAPQNWVKDTATLRSLTAKHNGQPEHLRVFDEVQAALDGLHGSIDGHQHPHGWSWETTEDPGLFIVTVPSTNDAAIRAATLILQDLNTYRETRQTESSKKHRRLVLLDEAGVLLDREGAPPIAALSEQLRSANIGLIVAGQSAYTLGAAAQRLLEAGVDYIVGKMANPEEFVKRSGTRRAPEVGHQADQTGPTGLHATREQAIHRLDPDRVRELPRGHFAIYTNSQVRFFVGLPPSDMSG